MKKIAKVTISTVAVALLAILPVNLNANGSYGGYTSPTLKTSVTISSESDLKDLTSSVNTLTFSGHGINDELIAKIKSSSIHKTVTRIYVSSCPNMGPASIKFLMKFRSIQRLSLAGVKFTDKNFSELKKMKQLSSLSIMRCKMSNSTLKEIVKCKRVKRLMLSNIEVVNTDEKKSRKKQNAGAAGDEGYSKKKVGLTFEGINKMGALEDLRVTSLNFAPGAMTNIKLCKRLTYVSMWHIDLSRQNVKQLKKMNTLRFIEIRGSHGMNSDKKRDLQSVYSKGKISLRFRQ